MKQLQTTGSKKASSARAWYMVFINAFVGCGIAASFPQFSMTVNQLAEKSGISPEILLTSDTVKSCGIVAAMLVSGFVYNKFGARKTFIFAAFATFLPQFLLPHIHSVALLMALKVLQGASSVIFPVFLVIILNWIDEKDAGLSTAIFNGIFYGGGGIGGTFAGIVIADSGWTASFYALGAVQIAICLLWFFTVKEKPPTADEDMLEEDHGAGGITANLNETAGAPAKKEKSLLLTPQIWLLSIAFFSTTWTVQAITVDMPLFGAFLGYDELNIGKILSAVTIGMIVSCLISGKASDFLSKNRKQKGIIRLGVLMFGHILIIASVCLLVFSDTTNFTLFYAAAFLFTFGGSWGLGSFYSILPEFYSEEKVPIVTGITGGIGDMGMPISPLVVGVIFGVKGFWTFGWLTCAAIALVSLLAALILAVGLLRKPPSDQ